MALNIDVKFEGKLNFAFNSGMRNLANFHQREFENLKIKTFIESFNQIKKIVRLKFTGELCVTTMKNDAKLEEELTCQFKIDMRNLTNFDPSTRKSQKCAL